MPNCIGITKQLHVLVGDEMETRIKGILMMLYLRPTHMYTYMYLTQYTDQAQLHYQRAHDRGFLTDFNVEEQIWNRMFGKEVKPNAFAPCKDNSRATLYTT